MANNTYEIIRFGQNQLDPCVFKDNCCIETKDWIIRFTPLLLQAQAIDV